VLFKRWGGVGCLGVMGVRFRLPNPRCGEGETGYMMGRDARDLCIVVLCCFVMRCASGGVFGGFAGLCSSCLCFQFGSALIFFRVVEAFVLMRESLVQQEG